MKPENIYKVDTFHSNGDEVTATIIFNEKHPLFAGHFPGNPVVPGVVQIQIIKDLAERHTGRALLLSQAKNIKFLSIISPISNSKVEINLLFEITEEGKYSAHASIRLGGTVFMKFAGTFGVLGK
jgi:3-hydroxyacyl-[acyl-carrier-protein] dehydratase